MTLTEIEADFSGDEARSIEKFELQMRDLLHETLSEHKGNYWEMTASPDFRIKIEERITDWLKQNHGRKRQEARELDFCQIMEYLKVARSQ